MASGARQFLNWNADLNNCSLSPRDPQQGSNWHPRAQNSRNFPRLSRTILVIFKGILFPFQCLGKVFGARGQRSLRPFCMQKYSFTMSSHFEGLSRNTTEIQALSSAWKSSPEIPGLPMTFQDSTNTATISSPPYKMGSLFHGRLPFLFWGRGEISLFNSFSMFYREKGDWTNFREILPSMRREIRIINFRERGDCAI